MSDVLTPSSLHMKILTLIPARMNSSRLPNKPLADICGVPMIVRVAQQAKLSQIGRVVVATDSVEILKTVQDFGFEAVMTAQSHQSGSDRIFEALSTLDPLGDVDIIVNLQGDLPTIDPELIQTVITPLLSEGVDIGTLACEITNDHERLNENVVKIVGTHLSDTRLRALYFTRATAPWGSGPLYHHIGIYAYKRASLEKFVALKPSILEQRERLEQLRALEANMRIDVEIVKTIPLGVDTQEDLTRAINLIKKSM
jgi:3-deoxy-manno-octulosonate cytidylyltransferase (CMP-KDO synthetase)